MPAFSHSVYIRFFFSIDALTNKTYANDHAFISRPMLTIFFSYCWCWNTLHGIDLLFINLILKRKWLNLHFKWFSNKNILFEFQWIFMRNFADLFWIFLMMRFQSNQFDTNIILFERRSDFAFEFSDEHFFFFFLAFKKKKKLEISWKVYFLCFLLIFDVFTLLHTLFFFVHTGR